MNATMLFLSLAVFTTHKAPNYSLASWYGPDFHGRLTSCGETFDMNNPFTFAHKELPPGCVCRITFDGVVDGERVRVSRLAVSNDDGPYCGARELDLSYALACSLTDNHSELGVIQVSWEVVGYKPRDAMRYNRYGTGEYESLFRGRIDKFVDDSDGSE